MTLPIKRNFYLGRDLFPDNMNDIQSSIDVAIARTLAKRGAYGLHVDVDAQDNGTSDFKIEFSAADEIRGYTSDGGYVSLDTDTFVTEDLAAEVAAIGLGSGETAWMTILMDIDYNDSQQERDYEFNLHDFLSTLTYQIKVVSGSPSGGTPTKPSLSGVSGLVLTDVLVAYGDTDFSVATFEKEAGRYRIDPVKEASDRGADGIDGRLVLTGSINPFTLVTGGASFGSITTSNIINAVSIPIGTKYIEIDVKQLGPMVAGIDIGHGKFLLNVDSNEIVGRYIQTDGGGSSQTVAIAVDPTTFPDLLPMYGENTGSYPGAKLTAYTAPTATAAGSITIRAGASVVNPMTVSAWVKFIGANE